MPDPSQVPAEDAPPKKGDRWLEFVYWTAGALAGLAILGALWLRRVDAEHQRILREARAAVEGLRVPEVPDEDNAARLYEKAYTLFSIPALDISRKYTGRLHEFELDIGSDEIAKLLADDAACLAVLAQAAEEPTCIFTADYSAGAHTKTPLLMEARAAALLLEIAAKRAAHDGKYQEAMDRLRHALCLGRGIGRHGRSLEHMIGLAIEEIALETLRDILIQAEPDAPSLQSMLDVLQEHSAKRNPLCAALRVGHLTAMLTAAEVTAGARRPPPSDWNEQVRFKLRRAAGRELSDFLACNRQWARVEEALSKPYPEAFREMRGMTQRPEFLRQEEIADSPYLSGVFPACRNDARSVALLRCARLAVACRLHKLRTGAPPADLKELAGYFPADFAQVAADPFNGKPMGYQRSETGFILSSVGGYPEDNRNAAKQNIYYFSSNPTFAVDPKLWAEYRAERVQALQKRAKPGPPPKPGVAAPRPPPPAPPAR